MRYLALATTIAIAMTGTSAFAQTQAATSTEHDHTHGAAAAPVPAEPAAPPATPAAPESQAMPGMGGMGGMHDMPMMQPTAANPFPPAEMHMHMAMMHATGADAAESYVRKMIEHHRGAIAMSQLVLINTEDGSVQRMANEDIAAQTREIADFQAWLTQHGGAAQ